jgi:sugar phosphate isomerase/epimerase
MISLSTSFLSNVVTNGEALVESIAAFQVGGIELEYRIRQATFEQMRAPLKKSGLKVLSIHNYFPTPLLSPPIQGSGDLFLLSALDNEERQRAIKWTSRTIEHANDLEAPIVILHCGRVEMSPALEQLYRYVNSNRIDSSEAQAFLRQKRHERDKRLPGHADALLFSLDRLLRYAEKQGVVLALENRYHYHELPTPQVLKTLFAEFKGGPIGYWHDTGHAHASEVLGFIPPGSLLQEFKEEVIGMHWHDAVGLDDHLVPGQGEIDYGALEPYLNNDLPIVIELKPGTANRDVEEGIKFTRALLRAATESRKSDQRS